MKEIEYKPTVPGFEGYIKLKLMNYKERMALMSQMGIKVGVNGIESDTLDLLEKLSAKASEFVTEVKLKYGDAEFTTLEDLSYYAEGNEVLQELMRLMMTGMSLGKS